MNGLVALLFAALCLALTTAFAPVRPIQTVAAVPSTKTALNVFGNKKSASAQSELDTKFWQGEWVCKDCGYIYNRVRSMPLMTDLLLSCATVFVILERLVDVLYAPHLRQTIMMNETGRVRRHVL